MWKGTICAPTPWGGKPGGTAYGSQLEEWKATGLDCLRMLHTSKVKQFSNMFSSFCIMSKGLPLCSFLFQTFPFAPIAHFHSWTCLATQTSLFWALGLLLGSLHKARDVEGCLPSLPSDLPNNPFLCELFHARYKWGSLCRTDNLLSSEAFYLVLHKTVLAVQKIYLLVEESRGACVASSVFLL